ncbi:hypothetical protein PR002_g28952, partial [Phytophthora rubi]
MSVESCPRKRAASQSLSAPRQQHSTAAPRQQHQRLTLPSGRPTHYAVFDCQTRPRGCADDALFLSYRRYYMLHDLMK